MSASFSTPYAQPHGRVATVPLQGAIGPYVPMAVRVPALPVEGEVSGSALPWIDAFLTATPAFGAAAIPAPEAPVMEAPVMEAPAMEAPAPDTLRWYRYEADVQLPAVSVPEGDRGELVAPADPVASVARAVPRGDSESAEAAAMALELLALRVRAGELPLSGYDPSMGDAAALVAALAALLGVRLGD